MLVAVVFCGGGRGGDYKEAICCGGGVLVGGLVGWGVGGCVGLGVALGWGFVVGLRFWWGGGEGEGIWG